MLMGYTVHRVTVAATGRERITSLRADRLSWRLNEI
jgi:hypothetical protein